MEKFIPEIITGLCSITVAIVAGLIAYRTSVKSAAKEIEKMEYNFNLERRGDVYQIKKNTICEALRFIDIYLSWLSYSTNVEPEREVISSLSLTKMGRECYNNLCLTCNKDTIDAFNAIIFGDSTNSILESYSRFRNEARRELGLEYTEFDSKRVFFSRISTDILDQQR